MSTVINTPGPIETHSKPGGNSGWIVTIVVLILVIVLGFFFWPQIMAMSSQPATPTAQTGNQQPTNVTNNNTYVNATSTTNNINATTTGGVRVQVP